MPCSGNSRDHCCKIRNGDGSYSDCPFLITDYVDEDGRFRRWACSLRAELGDWDRVLADARWIAAVKDSWAPGVNCRDWPEKPDEYSGCGICGAGE